LFEIAASGRGRDIVVLGLGLAGCPAARLRSFLLALVVAGAN
jgi:hypothetical protein